MPAFDYLNEKELSIIANIAALAIADDRDATDLNLIGNFVVAVGGMLLIMAAQKEVIEKRQESEKQIKDLNNQINDIKKGL